MARFANPHFQGAGDAISQIMRTRLQGPMMEGQLRGLLAGARKSNAGAALDEQTFGSRTSLGNLFSGAANNGVTDPNGLLLNTIGNILGGGNDSAIRNIGGVTSTVASVPGVNATFTPSERDNVFVGTGTQNAKDTFTGLGDLLAARGRGGGGGRVGGGGGRGRAGKLSAGGRGFLERNLKAAIKTGDAGGFEGADTIISDAVAATERLMADQGIGENEAISEMVRMLEIEQPQDVDLPGTMLSRAVPEFIGGTPAADIEAAGSGAGRVNLGGLLTGADVPAVVPGDNIAPPPVESGLGGLITGEETGPADPVEIDAGIGQPEVDVALALEQALEAIQKGNDPQEVFARLRAAGIDPGLVGAGATQMRQ